MNGHDERPRYLDAGHQPLGQAQIAAALGLEDEPAQQGSEDGCHRGGASRAQDQRCPWCAPGGKGGPDRDDDRAERGPGQVLRSRAVRWLG
jgi:hypothetical protein